MMLFIIFQMMLNVGLLAVGYWIYSNNPKLFSRQDGNHSALDQWRKEWELEKQNQEQQLAVQLRSMRSLYDQTKRLLDEKQALLSPFPPSYEETEIKSLVIERVQPEIPTLAEFELEKERLRHEPPLDLKSILKEQLC